MIPFLINWYFFGIVRGSLLILDTFQTPFHHDKQPKKAFKVDGRLVQFFSKYMSLGQFSIKNLVQHGLFWSIGGWKFNGCVKIQKLISPRTTLDWCPLILLRLLKQRDNQYCLRCSIIAQQAAKITSHHYTLKRNVGQQLFTKPSPSPATCRLCEYQCCVLDNIALQSIVVGLAACQAIILPARQ